MKAEKFDVPALLEQMATELARYISQQTSEPAMIGIHTGGVWLAEILHQRLALSKPLGQLDISFYRDDFSQIGVHPQVHPSKLCFEVDNQHIILVDDVLYTGRTIRAALNELFDYGRPACVTLAVLVERDGRELPIHAQVVGTRLELDANQQIKLRGPAPLSLHVLSLPPSV